MFLGLVAFNMSIQNIRVRCKRGRRGTETKSDSFASMGLSTGTGLGMIQIEVFCMEVVSDCNRMMIAFVALLPCLLGCHGCSMGNYKIV